MDKSTVIKLSPRVPADVTLAYVTGKPVAHGKRMFSTIDKRVFFVSDAAGVQLEQKLRELGVGVGDRVLIQHDLVPTPEGKQERWNIFRTKSGIGQPAAAELRVPVEQKAAGPVRPPATDNPSVKKEYPAQHTNPAVRTGQAAQLRERAMLLVDIYADALRYAAEAHRDVNMSREDIRQLVLGAYAGQGGK